ncbi:MAG: hypothetical protein ABSF21_00895 [Dehalococcoidia bacterium]
MADESREEYKLFIARKEEMASIFARMDTDEGLYFLTPYKMKKLPPQDSKNMEGIANVTLPDSQAFVNKAKALLGGLDMQKVIEGRDKTDKETTKIEEFLDDIYYMIDERLVKQGKLGLDGFTNEQDCVRGRIPARSCMKIDEEGNFIPDVLPLDARCFVSDNDGEDMTWGAPWFMRSKAKIQKEYGDNIKVEGAFGEVVDFWNPEKNVVFVDKNIVKEQENPYKYPPFIEAIAPFGSMLSTENATAHQGESILWPNRTLYDEKNRIVTILTTMTIEALRGGMQLENEKGMNATKPGESPYGAEKVNPVEKGGGYRPMPINDIKSATRLLYSIIEADLQKTGFTALDYGSLTFPLAAITVTKLTIARNDIMLPYVQNKAVFNQALSRMIIDQCIMLNKTLNLGQPGSQNTYSPSDLKGAYTITYRFLNISKEQGIADLSIANAAQGYYSSDTIRREILKVKDPDGEKIKYESEQAEKVDEVLFLYRRASSLLEGKKVTLKNQVEAYILAQRIVTILGQRQMTGTLSGIEKKVKPGETQQGKELIPLLSGGGGQDRPSSTGTEPTVAQGVGRNG